MTDGKGVTVLFLGSGFSKAVGGVPIQNEFLEQVLKNRKSWINYDDLKIGGQKLSHWMLEINNVEVCMSHLHNLAYSELATPSSKSSAKKAIINLRAAIREFLMAKSEGEVSKCEFKSKIVGERDGRNLVILTVNYDLLIEEILAGKYEYPDLLIKSGRSLGNSDENKIPLYKLHGSINWMEEREFGENDEDGRRALIGIDPLYVDDPEKWMEKGKNKSKDCDSYRVWKKNKKKFTPIMIPFFYQKEEWLGQRWGCLFQRHWASAAKCLEKERIDKMFFIGYRLPPADTYMMSWLIGVLERIKKKKRGKTPEIKVIHNNPCGEPIEKALAPYLKEGNVCCCGLQQYLDGNCR